MVAAVTGIDGFLGKQVATLMQKDGISVLPVSRREGYDIRSRESLAALGPFDVMIHLAAVSYVPDSYKNPHLFYDTNVNGTLNVLEQVRRYNARMVYISTYVYGQPLYQPIDEAHPVQPFNPYAQSKVMAEELCNAYFRDFNVPSTVFRPFNIYGYGQAPHFLLPKLVMQHLKGEEVTVYDARPKRDYIHVTDVARVICNAVFSQNDGYHVYNIGSGRSFSIPQVCELLQTITGRPLRLNVLNQERPAEILDTICNSQKAKEILDWQPYVDFQEGLREMIEKAATKTTYE